MLRARAFTRSCAAAVVVVVALFWLTIDRVPVVWGDEEYFASAAYSLARGGDAIATVVATGPELKRVTTFYGPVFPYVGSWAFRVAGINAVAFRSIGILAAVSAALCAALFVRAAGASRPWPLVTLGLVLLSPELGSAANGRMDTMALAFEVGGLVAVASALRRTPAVWGALAGALWALAVLTTPRTLPFFAAVGLATAVVFLQRAQDAEARRLLQALVAAAIACAVPVLAWTVAVHGSPFEWIANLSRVTVGNAIDASALLGGQQGWGLTPNRLATPLLSILCVAVCWPRARSEGRGGHAALHRFALTLAFANVAVGAAVANRPFETAVYYSPHLLIAALGLCGVRWTLAQGQTRACVVLCAIIAVVFLGVRSVKYVEAATSWEARDPLAAGQFMQAHVPRGALVYSRVPGYFYSIEGTGASYRSYPPWFSELWTERVDVAPVDSPRPDGMRFLLWPTDRTRFPLPAEFACVERGDSARFEPKARRRLAIPGWSHLANKVRTSLYEPVILYRLTGDCGPHAAEDAAF